MTQMLHAIDALAEHAPLWEKLQPILHKRHFPQAMLLVGPRHAHIRQFAQRFIAAILCQQVEVAPCGACDSCHLLQQGTHPDVHVIVQDKQEGAIKIEQIRNLQQEVYQTPQCGKYRFIVIEPANKMNIFAANALLKILEEPPSHTGFILIAEHLGTVPATITSRCQHYVVSGKTPTDYMMLAAFSAEESGRLALFEQTDAILTIFCELIEEKISPCEVATRWNNYHLDDLLWYLYLLTAQLVHYQLLGHSNGDGAWDKLAHLIQAPRLLNRLDHINALTRKINKNITINKTLAIESLLLGYLKNKELNHCND